MTLPLFTPDPVIWDEKTRVDCGEVVLSLLVFLRDVMVGLTGERSVDNISQGARAREQASDCHTERGLQRLLFFLSSLYHLAMFDVPTGREVSVSKVMRVVLSELRLGNSTSVIKWSLPESTLVLLSSHKPPYGLVPSGCMRKLKRTVTGGR